MAKTASSIFFHFLVSWSWLITLVQPQAVPQQIRRSPLVFLFGDSTLDVGTNNYLPDCTATADHPHHGIDFPLTNGHPAGRFSNGLNTADCIVRLMGHELSPLPYFYWYYSMNKTSTFRLEFQNYGVNFASGSSGLLDSTGFEAFKQVVPMGEQIDQFVTIRKYFARGDAGFLSESIFLISVGSNDIFDYRRFNFTIDGMPVDFVTFGLDIRTTYAHHITRLYHLGARKFAIISMPPLGCCPYVRARNNGLCLQAANDFAQSFYADTKLWLAGLLTTLPEMKYSIGNAYAMTMNIIRNPFTFKIEEEKVACCGSGKYNGENECRPNSNLCPNRKKYLFWDWFHPTTVVSGYAARTLYEGDTQFVEPINFQQLVEL